MQRNEIIHAAPTAIRSLILLVIIGAIERLSIDLR
jgi:hypothetical protein